VTRRAPPGLIGLLLAAWTAATLTAASPQAATRQGRSWGDYRILVERNMFRRDRRVRSYRTPTTRPRRQYTYDSDESIVLRGIARHDGRFVAFFEDTRTGEIIRVRAGQAVGKGKVQRMTLDEVEYARSGAARQVSIGRSLAGTAAALFTPPPTPAWPTGPLSGTTAPATRPAGLAATTAPTAPAGPQASPKPAAASDISDILERMRRRREQELRR